MRPYRPQHSAHGGLYWRLVMWPLLLSTRIPRAKGGSVARRHRHGDSVVPEPVLEGSPPAPPRSALPTTWLSPRQGSVWLAGEGSVRPEWRRGVRSLPVPRATR
jgi:hypothetical protein